MALDDTHFDRLASEALDMIMDRVDAVLGDDIDVEMQGGILTLDIEDGGQYVINKHQPNRQIWLSSPASGASHFSYDEDMKVWRSTRSEDLLLDVLAAELKTLSGQDITFT